MPESTRRPGPATMQELSDCGINPFAVQLPYESWNGHQTSPRAALVIPFCDCLCERCGQPFAHHPMDWRVIGYGNVPFLNVLCGGERVKLWPRGA